MIISGCVATEKEYVSYDKQGRKTVAQPNYVTVSSGNYCSTRMGDSPLAVRKAWADAIGVSTTTVPKYFCGRLNDALYAGKISSSDYRDAIGSGVISARALRILRGDRSVRQLIQ
jgi:hypothetical protein